MRLEHETFLVTDIQSAVEICLLSHREHVVTGLLGAAELDDYNKQQMLSFQNYVPTVFENYTASFEIDKHRIELNMWDTSGKAASLPAPSKATDDFDLSRRTHFDFL